MSEPRHGIRLGLALRRSLTFWAGLLVIVFTFWAWRDSSSRTSSLHGIRGSAQSAVNGLHIEWGANWYEQWGIYRKNLPANEANSKWQRDFFPLPIFVHHEPNQENAFLDWTVLKSAMQARVNLGGPSSWSIFLPYWIIMLALAITWSALLLRRARRQRRALRASA
ncbi:hypothetical protein [Luteolibacter soli]|uniref:Uncharacterized protein n=1 Tax=Luteolibacter soli TaxID=3135280 RepID=A0ABU9B2S9_9BACT